MPLNVSGKTCGYLVFMVNIDIYDFKMINSF